MLAAIAVGIGTPNLLNTNECGAHSMTSRVDLPNSPLNAAASYGFDVIAVGGMKDAGGGGGSGPKRAVDDEVVKDASSELEDKDEETDADADDDVDKDVVELVPPID